MDKLDECRKCAAYLESLGLECGGCPRNPDRIGLPELKGSLERGEIKLTDWSGSQPTRNHHAHQEQSSSNPSKS